MSNLTTVELKAFVPSRDFELSKSYYADLGFTIHWSDSHLAYMSHGNAKFLLQNYYVKEFADNLMMYLLVEDLDGWLKMIDDRQIVGKYANSAVKLMPPEMSADEFAKGQAFEARQHTGLCAH